MYASSSTCVLADIGISMSLQAGVGTGEESAVYLAGALPSMGKAHNDRIPGRWLPAECFILLCFF